MNKCISAVIALIGQKNVGKSTLFNRLTQTHAALVPNNNNNHNNNNLGFTRDRQYGYIQYKQCKFIIVDTGGFDRLSNTKIQNYINQQVILAIKESCVVLFVVDGRLQISSVDYDTVNFLRTFKKKILMVINKSDYKTYNNIYNYTAYDYYNLGIKNVIFVSAIHGYGFNDLLKYIFKIKSKNFYDWNENCVINSTIDDAYCVKKNNSASIALCGTNRSIKLAIVGRPNSGKSTFINYVLKKNRMITSEIPGTTRDSIYIPTIYNNKKYILIDTAGVRRKKQISDSIEKVSILKTLQILKDAHITLFMIDINEGIVDQDLSLLKIILNNSMALIVVINKLDTAMISFMNNNIHRSLAAKKNFLNYAKIHFISSLYGNGIKMLFKSIQEIYQSSIQTISTAQLNRIMCKAIVKNPPPFLSTRFFPKLKYVHIGGHNPTTIIIHGTQVSKLSNEYQKYLKQFFYRSLNLKGVAIRIQFKDTINPFKYV